MKHTYISKSALRVISLILLLSIAFIPVLFTGCSKKDEDLTTLPETEPQADPEKINPFTGLKYEKSKVSSRPVFVSINNANAARPQWGLTSPDMIMEF